MSYRIVDQQQARNADARSVFSHARLPALATSVMVLAGCASGVSLDEPHPVSGDGLRVVYASSLPQASVVATSEGEVLAVESPAIDPGYARAFPVRDAGITGSSWNPDADANPDLWGGQRLGRMDTGQKSNFEFEQKLDDTWVVKQTLRYGSPTAVGDGVSNLRPTESSLQPGSGTFNVGTQALAKFQAMGMQHQFRFGFDYLKTRDIYQSQVGIAPSLDIFDPIYGTTLRGPRYSTRAYMEQSQLGMYVQDQITYQKWTLSMVGRRDLLNSRTIDLASADDGSLLQSNETLSGRMGLKYQFDSGFAPYLNYSNTYAPVGGNEYLTTTSQQVETGVKFQPPTAWGKLMTVSAFNQIQNNTQSSDPAGGCSSSGCDAWSELRVRGASLESRLQPVEGLKVVAAYMVTNSAVTGASADAYSTMLANRFPTVTEQQVSVKARYAIERGNLAGLTLDGRVGRTGATYGYGGATDLAPSYVLVDAGVNYDFGRVSSQLKGLFFRASASNLLDKGYVAYCYTDSCSVGVGRSVTATVNYQMPWP